MGAGVAAAEPVNDWTKAATGPSTERLALGATLIEVSRAVGQALGNCRLVDQKRACYLGDAQATAEETEGFSRGVVE